MSWKLFAPCLLLVLAGCQQDDPVWDMPCEQRPARSVLPGTGEDEFVPAAAEPIGITYGDQGGSHIWFAVRLQGFGPTVSVTYGIVDSEDETIVYSGPSSEGAELEYNSGEQASEAYGLFALLDQYDPDTMMGSPNPSGRPVRLWAEVVDQCTPEPVRGEAVGEVR